RLKWSDREGEALIVVETPTELYDFLQGQNRVPEVFLDSYLTRLAQEANPDPETWITGTRVVPKTSDMTGDWREQLRTQIEGVASNQGREFGNSRIVAYNGLNYRSQSEIAIAKLLELVPDLLFLPNCAAVSGKLWKEPDFLIFYKGLTGILEVDGPTHSGRLAEDTLRDSYFQGHSIFVKHYTSEQCRKDAAFVVKDFLKALQRSRG
ncbi:MAG: hypothetical protein U0838_07670, partial [Chloroflexota bacterium]